MNFRWKSFLGLFLAAAQMGCGASKDSIEIAVNIGVPVRPKAAVKLSNNLMDLMSISYGSDCYQDQVYLVVYDNDLKKVIASKKVLLRTIFSGSPPAITNGAQNADISSFITRLTSPYAYLDEPLSISVPKGRNVEVGILGAIYNPDSASNTGMFCVQRVSNLALKSASIVGHRQVTDEVLKTGSLNLNIFTLVANPTAPYDGSAAPNNLNIVNFPPKRDFFAVQGGATSISVWDLTLTHATWLEGPNNSHLITQDLNTNLSWDGSQIYYIPHLSPTRLYFNYTTNSSAGCGGYPAGCQAKYYFDMPASGGSLSSITAIKYQDVTYNTSPATLTTNFTITSY